LLEDNVAFVFYFVVGLGFYFVRN